MDFSPGVCSGWVLQSLSSLPWREGEPSPHVASEESVYKWFGKCLMPLKKTHLDFLAVPCGRPEGPPESSHASRALAGRGLMSESSAGECVTRQWPLPATVYQPERSCADVAFSELPGGLGGHRHPSPATPLLFTGSPRCTRCHKAVMSEHSFVCIGTRGQVEEPQQSERF